jgi:hypothetical protein
MLEGLIDVGPAKLPFPKRGEILAVNGSFRPRIAETHGRAAESRKRRVTEVPPLARRHITHPTRPILDRLAFASHALCGHLQEGHRVHDRDRDRDRGHGRDRDHDHDRGHDRDHDHDRDHGHDRAGDCSAPARITVPAPRPDLRGC